MLIEEIKAIAKRGDLMSADLHRTSDETSLVVVARHGLDGGKDKQEE